MDASELILAILRDVPAREVRGKKRLQKLAYLLKEAGVTTDAEFFLHDYGPYSTNIAQSASMLAFVGHVSESEEPVGASRTFVTVYRPDDPPPGPRLSSAHRDLLRFLDQFSTVELEVAGTVRLFERKGYTREVAVARTQAMKPNKAIPLVLGKAEAILHRISGSD